MQVHVLASGSTGNAILFRSPRAQVLIDAGISCRRIEQGLARVGVKAGDLDAVLITHEHNDHVKGIDVLVRKHHIPVFAKARTWQMISCQDKLPSDCVKLLENELELKDLYIRPFATSHDAVEPVGFCLFNNKIKSVVATDLGIINRDLIEAISLADIVVLEANHDINMVKNGSYPAFLKNRILGNKGHLSNIAAGKLLASVNKKATMQVFLAHLSQENNRPSIAYNTVNQILTEAGHEVGKDIFLKCTSAHQLCSYIA